MKITLSFSKYLFGKIRIEKNIVSDLMLQKTDIKVEYQ